MLQLQRNCWRKTERVKKSYNKFVLDYHDVLDIKYSMDEINEFIYLILVRL